VVAAKSVGQVLAQRCREAGITAMILHEEEHDEKSQKVGDSVVQVYCNKIIATWREMDVNRIFQCSRYFTVPRTRTT